MTVKVAAARPRSKLPGRPKTRQPLDAANLSTLVGMRLLQAVANLRGPASLTEISQVSALAPSRAYRYLTSLVHGGFLTQDETTGHYDLGLAVLELGMAAMSRIDAIRLAGDVMRQLTEALHIASVLSVWGSNGPTVIKTERGRMELAVQSYAGLNLAVPITAAGRIFMTYLDEAKTRAILARDLKAWNDSVLARQRFSTAALAKICRDVRSRGLACTIGLRTPNIAALAAPVFNQSGTVSMAISLIGVVGSIDVSEKGEPARLLKASAARLSRMLGWRSAAA